MTTLALGLMFQVEFSRRIYDYAEKALHESVRHDLGMFGKQQVNA
jgi:hypothetical protein